MAKYFSVPLLGAQTSNVEHLVSYFGRLASAHHVSRLQLLRHINAWLTTQDRAGALYLLSTRSLAMCGYGKDVLNLVEILEAATGVRNLRSSTLLALSEIASPNGIAALKSSRAWCPACLLDDAANGQQYDRLLWIIYDIDRCPEHKLKLITKCPRCDNRQFYYRFDTNYDTCVTCGGSLIPNPSKWIRADIPSYAEKDAVELIELIASELTLRLNVNRLHEIFVTDWRLYQKRMRNIEERKTNIDMFPKISVKYRPSLSTMFKIARLADIPLTLILQEPEMAAKQLALANNYLPCLPRAKRYKRQHKLRNIAKNHLENILANPELNHDQVLSNLGLELGVSRGYFGYWFPGLCTQITAIRREFQHATRKKIIARMRDLLTKGGLLEEYITGRISSQDKLINEIIKRLGITKYTARIELSRVLKRQRSSKNVHTPRAKYKSVEI